MKRVQFEIGGHPHLLVKPQRRYKQDGFLIQRVHNDERCGHSYWVANSSIPVEAITAYADLTPQH